MPFPFPTRSLAALLLALCFAPPAGPAGLGAQQPAPHTPWEHSQPASWSEPPRASQPPPLRPPAPRTARLLQPGPTPPPAPGNGPETLGRRNGAPPSEPVPGERTRLPLLPALPPGLGLPADSAEVREEYGRYVARTIDPEAILNLVVGRPRILVFRETPLRIYIARDDIASYEVISDTELAVVGEQPGRTVLTVWMPDRDLPGGQRVLSYLLQVVDDPDYKERLEAVYAALEAEINRHFPTSRVKLSLVGDQLIVRGQARDVIEADHIMRVVQEHAPPRRNSRRDQREPANVTVNQTAYSPEGVLQTQEQFGLTLERLTNAGLEGSGNVINLLSIPGEQQVMLRVTVAEVNRSALRRIGTNLAIGGPSGAGFGGAFPSNTSLAPIGGVGSLMMLAEGGTLSVLRGDLGLAVNALKQHNLARSLAEPNLVTLHGRPASFQAGGQFPVPSARVGFGSAAQGVEFIPFGVQLQFVPFIVDRDKIRLNIAANVSTRDDNQSAEVGGTTVPSLNSRNFQNTVELREGQTLAVAGLMQTNYGATASRVPWVGDLPFLGRLFANDGSSADEQELVILITPELVHPLEPDNCLTLPGSDLYEPSDNEFFLRGRIESRQRENYRSPVRNSLDRQRRYLHCDDVHLIGDHGYSNCRQTAMPQLPTIWPGPEVIPAPAGRPGAAEGTPQ